MKNLEDKIILAFYGLFGAFLGFLIFAVALGGWRFLLTNQPANPWNGMASLILCVGLGFGWGLFSYKHKNVELGSGGLQRFDESSEGALFAKRLMVVATCVAGLYFIWQLAKGL